MAVGGGTGYLRRCKEGCGFFISWKMPNNVAFGARPLVIDSTCLESAFLLAAGESCRLLFDTDTTSSSAGVYGNRIRAVSNRGNSAACASQTCFPTTARSAEKAVCPLGCGKWLLLQISLL